jgi:F0F1-type ATP synthase epsilon subunit
MAETKRGGETGVRCVITTPESTVLDTRAEYISVPLFDGQRGIGRGHAPFVGRLGVGEVLLKALEAGVGAPHQLGHPGSSAGIA